MMNLNPVVGKDMQDDMHIKKIIDGRRYDTRVAKLVCVLTDDEAQGALITWQGLFQMPRGGFFLVKWTEDVHGGECYGTITPMEQKAAQNWCEKRITDEEFLGRTFGEIVDGGDDDIVMQAISRSLRDDLKVYAANQRKTMREVVETVLKNFLTAEASA